MKKGPTKVARSWLFFALLALLAISAVGTSAAQVEPPTVDLRPDLKATDGELQSYIIIMEDWPLAVYEGGISGLPATKAASGMKLDTKSAAAKNYDTHLRRAQSRTLARAGLSQDAVTNSYTVALNGFSAMMSATEAEAIRQQDGVLMVMKDQWRQAQSADRQPLGRGHGKPPKPDTGYDGEGVLVGIIDSGIWPEHPSFADDGTYQDAPVLENTPDNPSCDFGNTAANPDDAPFTCNNKLVGARQMMDAYRASRPLLPFEYDSARDDFGHGTAAASIVAGNRDVNAAIFDIDRGDISGVAPRAQVIAYKVLGPFGALTSDLAAAVDQAVADGVDVINYGSGGGAAVPGADEMALLFAANAGVFVATGAGNSGPAAGSVGNPGTMPWLTTVAANTQQRQFQGTVVLGNHHKYYGASITHGVDTAPLIDAEDAGNEFCVPGAWDSSLVAGKIVLCRRGAVPRPVKSLAVLQAGGVGTILYNDSDEDNPAADEHWTPAVHLDNTPGLAIKAYIDSAGSGATARIIGDQYGKLRYAPSITQFSSRGPNPVAADIIKPDITAPGSQVLSGYTPTPYPGTTVPGQLFAALEGTSFSSPYVAGAFALLKEAHPDWSPAMAKSAVMTTTFQDVLDNDRVSPADPFDMGSGHLNLFAKRHDDDDDDRMVHLDSALALDKIFRGYEGHTDKNKRDLKNTPFDPGLTYDAGFNDYLGFLCDAFPELFRDPEATCSGLEASGVPIKAFDLNYPSIGVAALPGVQTIVRTVTADFSNQKGDDDDDDLLQGYGWSWGHKKKDTIKFGAKVKAPPGYEVRVEPKKLYLRDGETATYTVTITNRYAPVGEWRFGSLTWRGGGYEVYSPISVRATLFDAPAEIEGSGEAGSENFDVTFGYTGGYTAAPHGLEPATITSDNVVQDPDQSFDPGDGYSNPHQFALSGALYFRAAMPPEATEPDADLDLFLQDPTGAFVAASESGGTNEQLDVEEPMDGIWTVWVHGYNTPGGDSDYDLYTWAISETPGGSLSIDAAPTTATAGVTESIDVSWSGATAGQWYLGAVSHTGDAALIGTTLVNVDNR